MDQVVDIFAGKTDRSIVLDKEWERLWYLGHQALNASMRDYDLFAFNCLYKAAEIADQDFYQKVAKVTGKTIPHYLETLARSLSLGNNHPQLHADFDEVKLRLSALEQWRIKNVLKRVIKRIPFAVPTYRFLKRKIQNSRRKMTYGAVR